MKASRRQLLIHEHLDSANELWQATITRPLDILTVLAYVDEQVGSGANFAGLIDSDLVAVMGHSYGGYTALAAAGAKLDTDSFEGNCGSAYASDDPLVFLCDQLLPHKVSLNLREGPKNTQPGLADTDFAADPAFGLLSKDQSLPPTPHPHPTPGDRPLGG